LTETFFVDDILRILSGRWINDEREEKAFGMLGGRRVERTRRWEGVKNQPKYSPEAVFCATVN
jgi:hypothetical protein